jgi:hypothetical protein
MKPLLSYRITVWGHSAKNIYKLAIYTAKEGRLLQP